MFFNLKTKKILSESIGQQHLTNIYSLLIEIQVIFVENKSDSVFHYLNKIP